MHHCYIKAREGDPLAVNQIVVRLRPRLTKMAAYYARRAGEDPDDLVQEAWLGLLDALPHLDLRIGSPDQYLIRHARWRLLDHVRRARLRRHAPLDFEIEETAVVDDALTTVAVRVFAGRLKSHQRQVLDGLLAGLTWREVGERMGCTSANVAYHVRHIRRQYEAWCAGQL